MTLDSGAHVVPGSGDTLLVFFAGSTGDGGFAPAELIELTDSFSPTRLVVWDDQQLWYQRGATGVGQGLGGLTQRIRRIAEENRCARVVHLGSRMGGFAALLTATHTGADRVIAFNPQTTIRGVHRLMMRDLRWWRRISEARKLGRWVDADVRPRLEHMTRPVDVHYSFADRRDARHAVRLAKIPTVNLYTHRSRTPYLMRELHQRGELESIIATAMTRSARSA